MPPALLISGLAIATDAADAIVFIGFFLMGTAIGFVSTPGLTLLQASADDTEMGRVNSAHQFVRTLCITYGVAAGGAILLLVVDRRIGSVEIVRDVLRGEEAIVSTDSLEAIRDGLAWVHVFGGVVAAACLWAAITLRRDVVRRSATTDA